MNRIVLMVLRNLWAAPGAFIKLFRYAKHSQEYTYEEKWNHIHYIMNRAVKSGNIDLKVTGIENIPEEHGYMFYANHQGMFDVVAIAGVLNIPMGAVLKKELRDVPLIHEIMLCTGSYPMDREDVRQSLRVIQAVTKDVKEDGRRFLIFPEGTRSKKGNVMGEFHAGSFRCALKAKCPIVPIAFIDSFRVLDEKGSKPVSMQMHILKPIRYEEYQDMKTVELAALVKSRIQQAIDENT